ncbi:MAG: T9SS type A sorting domain-containing protein [Panacibacter sp.]
MNTIYQWKVASKCINISTSSFSPYSAIKTFTTAAAIAASNAVDLSTASSNALKILLQPNPAKTNTTLVINGTVKNASITITDFVGKTIWKKDGINSNQIKLPVQNFAAGMYIVKLTNGNETKVTKLVKE